MYKYNEFHKIMYIENKLGRKLDKSDPVDKQVKKVFVLCTDFKDNYYVNIYNITVMGKSLTKQVKGKDNIRNLLHPFGWSVYEFIPVADRPFSFSKELEEEGKD